MIKVLPPLKPHIPEPPAGKVWHIAPAGHCLWLDDYEYYDQLGRDPLQQAKLWTLPSGKKRVDKLQEILERYPKQKHRRRILCEAARRGDVNLVRCLVETGLRVHPSTDPDQGQDSTQNESESIPDVDEPTVTPVHAAANQGHLSCVKVFIEEAKVEADARDELGCTPLIVAYERPEVVRYLLGQGAEPMIRAIGKEDRATTPSAQYTGPSILDYAASSGKVEVVKMIMEHPSFQSSTDWFTPSIIQRAARGGVEILTLFLEKGGYPLPNSDGKFQVESLSEEQKKVVFDATPVAADQGDLESLKLLLCYNKKAGHDNLSTADIPDEWHKRFIYGLYNSMTTNSPRKFEFLNSTGLKEHESMSLDKLPDGQKINVQRLLEKAVEAGSIECTKLMIEKYGANPDKHRIPPGIRPLFIGALRDTAEMLRYLLENHDIDIHFGNGRHASGPTALWGAINLKSLDSIMVLLQHGGPVDRVDEELRNVKQPTRAILRGTWPSTGSRPMVFLQTEEHAKEYTEWTRQVWQNQNPRYVRLELDVDDNEWLRGLQLRKENGELRETGNGARELNEQEGDSLGSQGAHDVRNLMPPMPTVMDREAELKEDDDLIPEFRPYAIAPGYHDRLTGNPEVY
ncbi:ankyrin repeat-containing domain protein [Xylaria arbuscula]|nr:ankyrin repeat-containing domain protein [Xylaria arbuscula]